jgi:non-heme chloroperoxidase
MFKLTGSGGLTLAADEAGEVGDPTVLLFHGGGQTRHAWGRAIQALAARHWHAVTVDLPGHGDSDWAPDGDCGLDVFGSNVAGVARQYQQPVLVGASLGGLAGLAAIGQGLVPEAVGLVLVDITPRFEPTGVARIRDFMRQGVDGFDSLEAVADAIASYVPNRQRPRNLTGLTKNVRRRDDGKWVWHWDPRFMTRIDQGAGEPTAGQYSGDRIRQSARNVTVPVLLVHGASSDVVSLEGVAELQELVPHAEIVDVADAGHMVAGDRNDSFNNAVIDFLERVIRPQLAERRRGRW